MKKYIIASIFILTLFSGVPSANAEVYQINTPPSYQFSTTMGLNSYGPDVSQVQTWLISKGFDIPAISSGITSSGFFGSQTSLAVKRYQLSVGLQPTGYIGTETLAVMNQSYTSSGCNVNCGYPVTNYYPANNYPITTYPVNNYYGNHIPVINGIDAPISLSVSQMGTWTVRAIDPDNSPLSYSVDWGENSIYPQNAYTSAIANPQFTQTATFTHAYLNAGTYKATFTVRNSYGQIAQTTLTIQVWSGSNGAQPLHIISPNGGEVWNTSTSHTITWASPYYIRATYADLKLLRNYACNSGICPMIAYSPITIASNISINQNSYQWFVNGVPEGQYTIQICEANGGNCESSDYPFTITSSNYQTPVNCPAGYVCILQNR